MAWCQIRGSSPSPRVKSSENVSDGNTLTIGFPQISPLDARLIEISEGRRALMRETTVRDQVLIQASILGEIEHALSALLYTHKIAHKANEIARRSDRKDGEKTWLRQREGGNKKRPFSCLQSNM
jgi:hypothetical protein